MMESQAPRVTVEGFDGPLDLLLELVEEKKLDILTVRLGDLADAYLARVRAMAALPADEVSAFLALASRLVLLKARSLLPSLEPLALEDAESEEELRARLLEYAIVRERASQLGARLRAGERAFHREGGTIELPPRGGEVDALALAFGRVLTLAAKQREADQNSITACQVESIKKELKLLQGYFPRGSVSEVTSKRLTEFCERGLPSRKTINNRYAPRRRADDRFRRRHVHRAPRPVPPRRHRPGAGRALRGHRDHEEGTAIRSELANAVEAILFVAEKPVTKGELGRIAGGTPRAVENALAELGTAYEGTGLRLQRSGDEWQIVTAPQHAPQVAAYLGADRLRLSPASLETLSVVAYRQPVTRAEVEAIRGVNCDQTFYTLASRRLIEERGRKETPGRPILYGTTWEFLECFGLQSLDELPRALSPDGALVPGA